tara:strand:+ start:749 stop:1450 length:702 start_codon:yes stop_codon:yes gene_type:complete
MNKKYLILTPILFLSLLLSIGERTPNYSIYKTNYSFDNIMGWEKKNGGWEDTKHAIPSIRQSSSSPGYKLKKIDVYNVKEKPELAILIIDGREKDMLILNKEDIRKNLNFIKKEYNEIEIKLLAYGTDIDDYSDFVDIETSIKRKLNLYDREKDLPDDERVLEDGYFYIHYYHYNNDIQYFLSRSTWRDNLHRIYGAQMHTFNYIDINESFLEDKYFESPFNEFKSFLTKISN